MMLPTVNCCAAVCLGEHSNVILEAFGMVVLVTFNRAGSCSQNIVFRCYIRALDSYL